MAEEKDINQIIGAYLEGMLSEEETIWLEEEIQRDPELAALIESLRLEQRVEDYLHGNLSATEKAAFEKELSDNKKLKQAWEDYHLTRGVVKLKQREQYLEWFEQLGNQDPENNPSGKGPNRRPLLGGFLLILLLIAGWWYLASPNPAGQESPLIEENASGAGETDGQDPGIVPPGSDDPQSEPVDEKEATTPPTVPNPGDTDQEKQAPEADRLKIYADGFIQALPENIAGNNTLGASGESNWERAFRQAAYPSVIPMLDPVQDSLFAAKATKPLFFLAAGYLLSEREDRYQRANAVFARLNTERTGHRPSLMQEVDWYHALALISEDRAAAARPILQKIVESASHPHWNQARELLRLQNDSN